MAKVYAGRYTAKTDEPFVVFLIGMRINQWWRFDKWLPVALAVGGPLPMLMVGDAFAIYSRWREWDAALIKRMLPAAVGGALAGTFLLAELSANSMRLAQAVFALFLMAYKSARHSTRHQRYRQVLHKPLNRAARLLRGYVEGG